MRQFYSRFKEFSKKVIFCIVILWFYGAFFGSVMVWRTGSELYALLEYIAAPMTAGVLGYMLKSAFENKEKIKKNGGNENNDMDRP